MPFILSKPSTTQNKRSAHDNSTLSRVCSQECSLCFCVSVPVCQRPTFAFRKTSSSESIRLDPALNLHLHHITDVWPPQRQLPVKREGRVYILRKLLSFLLCEARARLIRLHLLSNICENPPSCKASITVLVLPFKAFTLIVFKVYSADLESAMKKTSLAR